MSQGYRYTAVPQFLDALWAMFAAACPSAGTRLPSLSNDGGPQEVAVIDGEPVSNLPATYVLVGYSAAYAGAAFSGSSGLAVEGRFTPSDMGNGQQGENFKVWCEISTAVGDTSREVVSQVRAAVGDLWAACLRALADDPHVGGTVGQPAYARVSDYRWLLDQAPDGFAVSIQFAVEVEGDILIPY